MRLWWLFHSFDFLRLWSRMIINMWWWWKEDSTEESQQKCNWIDLVPRQLFLVFHQCNSVAVKHVWLCWNTLFNSSEFADQEFAAHDSPAFPTFSLHAVFPLPVPAFMVRNSSFWKLHSSRLSNLYYRSSKREDPWTLSHLCCDIGMRENKKLVLFGIYVVAKMIKVLHVYQRPPSTSSVCLLLGGLNWTSWGLPRFSRSKAWLPRQAEL